MKEQNLKLLAVVKIRNLVTDSIKNLNSVKKTGREIDILTNKAIAMIAEIADDQLGNEWLGKIEDYKKNILSLKEIMNQVVERIQEKNSSDLSKIWNSHKFYSSRVTDIIQDMKESGVNHIKQSQITEWSRIWNEAQNKLQVIKNLADASKLKLDLIETLAPEDVNELTDAILNHMPKDFTEKQAEEYEMEYMAAYDELKESASKKKNTWDKFLDLLAGGTNQSPAEKVMMQRWVNGEKGNL